MSIGSHPRICLAVLITLGLGVTVSCEGHSAVSLTIDGMFPEARALYVRLIGAQGPLGPPHRFPEAGRALSLPGTVVLFPGPHERLGFVVWAENGAGSVIASVRSATCVPVAAGNEIRYRLVLGVPPAGWTPAIAEGCYCDAVMPMADMCPPTGIPDNVRTGGAGGAGGASGAGGRGGMVGVGGAGGAGGTAAVSGTGGVGGMGPTGGAAGAGGRSGTAGAGGVSGTGGTAGTGAAGGTGGTAGTGAADGTLFSFDRAGDWTSSEVTITLDHALRSQGTASIAFTPAAVGATYVRSRVFSTRETPGATMKLGLDVRLAQAQTPQANLQMWFECQAAAVYNAYVEYRSLAQVQPETWTTVTFNLPQPVAMALAGDFSGCRLWIDHQAAGMAHYDNLRFLP